LAALVLLAGLPLVLDASAEPVTLDIRGVEFSHKDGRVVLAITLAPGQAFRLTDENVGRSMEMRVDGTTVLKRIIQTSILGGKMQVTFATYGEARDVAAQLLRKDADVRVEIVGGP
jgi:preprotein translocase subunit SecD